MAHLTKAQKRSMTAKRTDMVAYLRGLMRGIDAGEGLADVIEFVNTGSVVLDMQVLLGRALTVEESTALLLTPEASRELHGAKFGAAHITALNMKHARQVCRTLLRAGSMEGIGRHLSELLGDIEAYLG